MGFFRRFALNRGRHIECPGHHWHMASMTGWRCCGCSDTYPPGDKPDSAPGVVCRLGSQSGRHHLEQEDPESAAWLAELFRADQDTGELPGLGRRRLVQGGHRTPPPAPAPAAAAAGADEGAAAAPAAGGVRGMVRAVAKVPRWVRPTGRGEQATTEAWRTRHRTGGR